MIERKYSLLLAFVAATIVTTVWGAIVQTQYNLAALASIGAAIGPGLRLQATLADVFSGFSPTYAAYVVVPALLVAFIVAYRIAGTRQRSRAIWFSVGGGLAILLAIPIVNYLAPVALLIGATRDMSCTVLMALGGAAAGFVFAAMTATPREPRSREPSRIEASTAH